MAGDTSTSESTADSDTSGADAGTDGRVPDLTEGPVGAATLLVLGSSLLSWRTVATVEGALTASPAGLAALLSAVSLVALAGVAVIRPQSTNKIGFVSVAVALTAVTFLLFANGDVTEPNKLFVGLLASSAGGALCVGWRPGVERISLRDSPSLVRAGRLALVVGITGVVVLNAGPAAVSAVSVQENRAAQSNPGTFPQEGNATGGFIVSAGTLDAGYYDYDPDCDLFADCPNLTTDSSKRDTVEVARMRLDNRHGNPLISEDFLIYKNFYLTDEMKDRYLENETLKQMVDAIYFEMSADRAVATGGENGRALDVYVSEVQIEYMQAHLDVVGGIDWDPGLDEIENYWTCNPEDAEGWGTINDDRLGVSADPKVTDGTDIQQLTTQLGSTETVLTNFKLEIGIGAREDKNPETEAPTSGCQ